MDNQTIASLQQQLQHKEQALRTIQGIDEIRDQLSEPASMLSAIVTLLAQELATDLCLLALLNHEIEEMELKAVQIRQPSLEPLISLMRRDIARRILALDKVTLWSPSDLALTEVPDDLQIAAVPIIIGEQERLGAMLLVRMHQPFADQEVELLTIAEDQIDSAVMQGHRFYEQQQRLKELETIYHIDQLRDQGLPFDEMLMAVLNEITLIIEAEIGFVMLFDHQGKQLEMRAATRADLFDIKSDYGAIYKLANQSLKQGQLLFHNQIEGTVHSVMCLPLNLNERIIGVLGVANHRRGAYGFLQADRRLLHAIGSQMDTAIFESLEQRQLRQVLGRAVDPRVMRRLLAHADTGFLKGERLQVTVLYADIRGSTHLAEITTPDRLVEFINSYLGRMTEVILTNGGTLDKFVGDEVMALFGAPFPQVDHALLAVKVALQMQQAHEALAQAWAADNGHYAPIGIGIATGELIAGEMGSTQRTDYTVIGRAANLGSRICSVAQGGQILLSSESYAQVKEQVDAEPIHGLQFKGVGGAVTVYEVTGLKTAV